jgi:4,5:9,10-diseco-3-hydroxy-5,9,17-trioxoandrosta-1(10),2-diene-4-oate hydrolase
MNKPQDRYIDIGPTQIRYWSAGNQGSPVLLAHGIGRYIEDWLPVFWSLSDNYQVYALDLPGHGLSSREKDISYYIDNLAEVVGTFLHTLGVEHTHLCGHSLGGAVVTWLTLVKPEIVNKLVLINSGGYGKQVMNVLRFASLPLIGEMITRPSRSGIADMAKMLVHDPDVMTPELQDLEYKMATQQGAQQAFLKTLRANVSILGQNSKTVRHIIRGIPAVEKPVLIIWGENDQIIPVSHAGVASLGFQEAQVHIFDECGHFPMLERSQ